ncbi:unnamed protein product [Owenia fusiformis]|uniref:Uncharacterized protein n=1 Tax=Owenia fusiformis TaxID=6347 RepID=A0A8J1T4J1_OWEFU|nr:unnamed protein product [Owenia fusiformis]
MCKINRAMGITSGNRILTVAASGTHAISKLIADPEQVVALDISTPQLHMSKLQATGIKLLSRMEFCRLLGINRKSISSTERIKIYQHIRSSLEYDTMTFWDRSMMDIADGVLYCGELVKAWYDPICALIPTIHDEATVQYFLKLGDNMEEQRRFYDQIWNTAKWRQCYESMMKKGEFYSRVSESFEDVGVKHETMFPNLFDRVVRHIPNNANEFLKPLLTGDMTEVVHCQLILERGILNS